MTKGIILCVDDDATILSALKDMLGNILDGQHTIELAESGPEALEICEELRLEGREVSVIISDFIMPSMRGDELLVRIHGHSPQTIKIMLTGQSDLEGVKRVINEANLYRFMEKPFSKSDMILTAKSALHAYHQERELEIRNQELETINGHLEELVRERTLELNHSLKVIKNDLQLAKKIQKSILHTKPELLTELNILTTYIPMSEVGGDFYDISKLNDFTYRIFLADATGHGVQAAMVTMAIKGIFDNIKGLDIDIIQVMDKFNNEYIHKYRSLNSYMTAILIDIDIKDHKLKYVSAGHPEVVLLQNNELKLLMHTGKMIGILKDTIYKSIEHGFQPNDRLILFTDGIFEEFNSRREEFGEERLYELITENANLTVEAITEKMLAELDRFLEGQEKQDDITILGIAYRN